MSALPPKASLTAPRRLDCGDVDLSHAHHNFKRALCFIASGRQRFDQYTRRDLPRHTPLVFAPAARAFLAAIIDDGVPVAIRLSLIVSGDLERKGFIMFERRTAVKADTGDTSNFELDRQHISLLARRIVTGCTVDGTHCAVEKGFGIKLSSGLGILIVPEANCVFCHRMSFRSKARPSILTSDNNNIGTCARQRRRRALATLMAKSCGFRGRISARRRHLVIDVSLDCLRFFNVLGQLFLPGSKLLLRIGKTLLLGSKLLYTAPQNDEIS